MFPMYQILESPDNFSIRLSFFPGSKGEAYFIFWQYEPSLTERVVISIYNVYRNEVILQIPTSTYD